MTAAGPVHGAVRAVLAVGFAGFAVSFGYSLYMLLVHGQAHVRRKGWVAIDMSDPVQWFLAGMLALGLVGTVAAAFYVLTRPIFSTGHQS